MHLKYPEHSQKSGCYFYYSEVFMQELFKKYREEICKYCKNKNCEAGKGIHIFRYKDLTYAKCTDYITNIKIKKCGFLLVGKTLNYKKED